MKPIYFNELTLDTIPQQNFMLLRAFRSVFARFNDITEKKVKRLFINDAAGEALCQALAFCGREPEDVELLQFVNTYMSSKEFISQEDEEHCKSVEYKLRLLSGEMHTCQTMGLGCYKHSLSMGLCSSRFWEQLTYEIEEFQLDEETLEEKNVATHEAICVTTESQLDNPKVQSRISSMREFERVPDPVPCTVPPEHKPIKFSDDHGREKLDAFCRSIVRHEYVCGVVNSLPYKDHENRFIVDCYDNGMIDVCLHWVTFSYGGGQRKGLSLRLQTVGIDKRQTEMIAEILKEKYDRRS